METTAHSVIGLLERRGVLEDGHMDRLADESPVLAGMTAASVQGLLATVKRAGMRVRRVLSDPEDGMRTGDLCYASRGFSLHAATRIEPGDREGLERLCRYVARPDLAAGSLTRLSEEVLSFKLKTPWGDGTTSILQSPLELVEKLAALVPPSRKNIVRYHGVFAPHAKDRDKIVPAGKINGSTADDGDVAPRKYRLAWAALLARVFQIQADVCSHCNSIHHYLEGTGQSAKIPQLAPARAPPQEEWEF